MSNHLAHPFTALRQPMGYTAIQLVKLTLLRCTETPPEPRSWPVVPPRLQPGCQSLRRASILLDVSRLLRCASFRRLLRSSFSPQLPPILHAPVRQLDLVKVLIRLAPTQITISPSRPLYIRRSCDRPQVVLLDEVDIAQHHIAPSQVAGDPAPPNGER